MAQSMFYRLTLYSGTLYSNTTTALTPASGSSHTDPFQVSTSTGVSGFQPFMQTPRGEPGKLDVVQGSSTVGQYRVDILDKRTGTNNDARWVSAFIGKASSGLMHIIGRKALIEQYDGTTWQPFFVGRVKALDLDNPLIVSVTIADGTDLLKQEIFRSKPRVSYAVFRSLVPVGLIDDLYITGDTNKIAKVTPLTVASVSAGTDSRLVTLDNASINRADNFWPKDETEATSTNSAIGSTTHGTEWGNAPLRVMIEKGGVKYHYAVDFLQRPAGNTTNAVPPIAKLRILELPKNDGDYSLLTAMDSAGTKTLWIYRLLNDAGDKFGTMWLRASPFQIIADICDGKMFASSSLSTVIPYNSGSLSTLSTTNPVPNTLYRVGEPVKLIDWIEDNICRPFNIGYTFDPVVNAGVAYSQMRFFSTRQPTTLSGSVTIDGTDVVGAGKKDWTTQTPLLSVTSTFYMESNKPISKATAGSALTATTETTIQAEYVTQFLPSSDEVVDATYDTETVDFNGLRGIGNDYNNASGFGSVYNITSYKYVEGQVRRHSLDRFNRRRAGSPDVRLTLVRNVKTSALRVGQFVLVSVAVLPNQATHTRGGTRVMQITQLTNQGLTFVCSLSDAGVNSVMATPSLSSVTTPSISQVSFTVTTSVDCLIEIEYAVATAGGSVPSAAGPQWVLNNVLRINNAARAVTLDAFPNGRRIYVRVRAVSPVDSDLQLPSPWVTSTGTELNAIAAPGTVTVSRITSRQAVSSWINTSANQIEVLLASPAGVPDSVVATLAPSSSIYTLRGLDKNPSTSHTVGVRYIDGRGGFSAMASASFTASGSAEQLPKPSAAFVFIGY